MVGNKEKDPMPSSWQIAQFFIRIMGPIYCFQDPKHNGTKPLKMLILLNLIICGILKFCYVEEEIFEMYYHDFCMENQFTVHPTSEFLDSIVMVSNQEPAVKVSTYLLG